MPFDKGYVSDIARLTRQLIEFIPHANYLTNERCIGRETKKKGKITGDFPMFLNAGGKVVFYLAKRTRNLILRHLEDAVEQLHDNGFYRPNANEIKEIVSSVRARDVISVGLEELSLTVKMIRGYAYFPIFPNRPEELSEPRLVVAKAVFGYGERFEQTMEMLKDYKIMETRILFPTPKYVLKNTNEGEAIAMVCRLESLDRYSSVHFNYKDVNNLVLELGKIMRDLTNTEVHESPLDKILYVLFDPRSHYNVQQKDELVIDLQSVLDIYSITRAEDAAKTTGHLDLIVLKGAEGLLSGTKTDNPLVAEVLELLMSPNSRYNRARKNTLALTLEGYLANFRAYRVRQFSELTRGPN